MSPAIKKPTKQQLKQALEDQNPQTSRVAPSVQPKGRTLKQAGITTGFDQLDWYKPEDWFDDDGNAIVFSIVGARLNSKGQYGPQVVLTLQDENSDRSLVSLNLDSVRQEYLDYFAKNSVPLINCIFIELPTSYGNPYYKIGDASEAEDIPF